MKIFLRFLDQKKKFHPRDISEKDAYYTDLLLHHDFNKQFSNAGNLYQRGIPSKV